MLLEVIASTVLDALRIEGFGGNRIELVSALKEGGLTPSYGLIKAVINSVKIPVNVMVRPHSNSFVYTDREIELMKEDILMIKRLGANGVVFGALDEKNNICEKSLVKLLEASDGLEVTFHRAIDELINPVEGIKVLRKYPIKNLLTSGGEGKIIDNISVIKNMIKESGNIEVLIGGGLTLTNIEAIANSTGVKQCHFGTAVRIDSSPNMDIDEKKLNHLSNIVTPL